MRYSFHSNSLHAPLNWDSTGFACPADFVLPPCFRGASAHPAKIQPSLPSPLPCLSPTLHTPCCLSPSHPLCSVANHNNSRSRNGSGTHKPKNSSTFFWYQDTALGFQDRRSLMRSHIPKEGSEHPRPQIPDEVKQMIK